MSVVWKFVIEDPETPVSMPARADILHVASQEGKVCIWALVDPSAPKVERRFVVVVTGDSVPPYCGRFHGTVLLHGGTVVLHVWDDIADGAA